MRVRWPLVLPLVLLLLSAYILPLLWLIPRSLDEGESFGLANYREILANPAFISVGVRTFQVAAITAVLCLLIGYPMAWHLSNVSRRWFPILAAIIAVPLLTSAIVRSEAWVFLMLPSGPIASLFRLLPGAPEVVLLRTEAGVVVAMVQVLLPVALLPLMSAFYDLDRNLLAAARNLGAKRNQTWREVILPLTAPAATASAGLIFLLALGFWVTPSIVGSQRTIMIAPLISQQASMLGDIGMASALAVTLLLTTLVLVIAFGWVSRRVFVRVR